MPIFFADTYAFVEYTKGNKAYLKYFLENKVFTTKLNLMELYYSALAEAGEEKAEEYYDSFLSLCIEVEDETVKEAMKFKYLQKKRNLSYVDAIGYKMAQGKGMRFLTGDKEFKEMENVEFVK